MKTTSQMEKAALIAALAKKNVATRGTEPGCTPCAFCNTRCIPAS